MTISSEVTRRYWEAGARVIDTSPLYGSGEYSVGDFLSELGANGDAFIANKIWSTGEYLADESHARRSFEQSQGRLWRDRIDVLQCHSLVNVDAVVPLMKAWKKEGRVRYVGVTHFENAYHDLLLNWIERGDLDFVQVNYSIFNRAAERVLEAAAQRGVAVLTNMPLEKARLHKAVEGQALPAFAREIGAETWAQFFLKWVIAHPAVTTTLCATSRPEHAAENVAALRGELPDREMRQRMVRHMETIPGRRADRGDALVSRQTLSGPDCPLAGRYPRAKLMMRPPPAVNGASSSAANLGASNHNRCPDASLFFHTPHRPCRVRRVPRTRPAGPPASRSSSAIAARPATCRITRSRATPRPSRWASTSSSPISSRPRTACLSRAMNR